MDLRRPVRAEDATPVLLLSFACSNATVEKSEIETIVGEFRQFREAAVDGEGKDQTIMVEIR
jgi:hypothetical protein